METWAHGQEVYDHLGVIRQDEDRIHNIAILGTNTYKWTFLVRQEQIPGPMPFVQLKSPSGIFWEFGQDNDLDSITGSATEFCQVVTQVRNVADTNLKVVGSVANEWMSKAQCFAGSAEKPPPAGSFHQELSCDSSSHGLIFLITSCVRLHRSYGYNLVTQCN